MALGATESELYAIERAHRNDADSGDRFVEALCRYRRAAREDAVDEWDRVLLGWARPEHKRLWGVALEALAREGGPLVSRELAERLRAENGDAEFRDYVANTLIRRRDVSPEVREHVEDSARRLRPMGLINVAALLRLCPDTVGLAGELLATELSAGRTHEVESNIPPFVQAALNSNLSLLGNLASEVRGHSHEQGARFSRMLLEYVNKPFVRKYISDADLVALRRDLGCD